MNVECVKRLGNFIEAIELGSDTIAMAEGPMLCRLGYFAKLYQQILRDIGDGAADFLFEIFRLFVFLLALFAFRLFAPNGSKPDIIN